MLYSRDRYLAADWFGLPCTGGSAGAEAAALVGDCDLSSASFARHFAAEGAFVLHLLRAAAAAAGNAATAAGNSVAGGLLLPAVSRPLNPPVPPNRPVITANTSAATAAGAPTVEDAKTAAPQMVTQGAGAALQLSPSSTTSAASAGPSPLVAAAGHTMAPTQQQVIYV